MTGRATPDRQLQHFVDDVGPQGPVAVEGARTRWQRGGVAVEGTRTVRAPTGIVAFEAAEMTVRVRAGTTVSELHTELAAAGQRTALPDRGGTIGGALGVGEDDACVLGVGRVRTALLQVRYVSADGRLITGGGPTVKNVSGFDLPRLMVGALGTLGLLGEVILRTNPRPPVARWLVAQDADPRATFDACFRPGAVLWDGGRTWVLLEGHGADVEAQQQRLGQFAHFAEVASGPELPPHRWSLRPSELPDLTADQVGDGFVASIGTGTVFSYRARPEPQVAPAVRALHERIKAEFDPTGRLNPGRNPLMN